MSAAVTAGQLASLVKSFRMVNSKTSPVREEFDSPQEIVAATVERGFLRLTFGSGGSYQCAIPPEDQTPIETYNMNIPTLAQEVSSVLGMLSIRYDIERYLKLGGLKFDFTGGDVEVTPLMIGFGEVTSDLIDK